MKKYIVPEIEIEKVSSEDIITLSNGKVDDVEVNGTTVTYISKVENIK